MLTITDVAKQETTLQFNHFTNDDAWVLGNQLVARAQAKRAAVTIDITRCHQQLFHAALPGTAIDNDQWLQRKINTVYHFGQSSLALQLKCEQEHRSLEEASLLPAKDYAAAGGAFPINIIGTGLVGTIAVSGMLSEEDHQLIVDCLSDFLKN